MSRGMSRRGRVGLGIVSLGIFLSGCYGPFNLTRRLYQWNGEVGTTWEREFMFLLLAWAPVYGIAVLGDALVFNSMEFWTGNNPVDPPGPGKRPSALSETRRLVRGDAKALLTYRRSFDGASLLVQQFQKGHPAGSLLIERRNGLVIGSDAQGRVLLAAHTLPDGSILVLDGLGAPMALHSATQVEQMMASASGADR